jgi:GGDEF domain-containing protein
MRDGDGIGQAPVGTLQPAEGVVLIEDARRPDDAVRVACSILGEFKTLFSIDGHELFTSPSIGIALGEGEKERENLLHAADLTMYKAKERGKARLRSSTKAWPREHPSTCGS